MNKAIGLFGGVAAAVAVFVFGFLWFCCRVYVPEGQMAIVTAKTGRPLPPGRILAEPGEKGVQRMPLAEGRHFLNPVNNDWRIVPTTTIPAGSVGVVTYEKTCSHCIEHGSYAVVSKRQRKSHTPQDDQRRPHPAA